jgi:AcrR family transcriptional regulator
VTSSLLQSVSREARREHILEAARIEFSEKGLDGASMRSVALRAGCTTGAIYPLFPTKETLYAELLRGSLERLRSAVAEAVARAGPAAARVEHGALALVDYYLERPFELSLGLYAFQGFRRLGVGAELDRSLNADLGRVLELVAVPLAERLDVDPAGAQRLVLLLFSQMMGALVLHATGRLKTGGTSAATLVRMQVRLMLATPRPGDVDEP